VIATLGRLLALAGAPRARVASAAVLGALAVVFGIGLMATAGYLISRAAERPPILSLTVAIVAVRFFGLARPLVRYLERLASHDVAFRSLGHARAGVYTRLEPLAPAQLGAFRQGDLLTRLVGDVDALQDLYLRGLGPPLVALMAGAAAVAVTAAILPAAAAILGAGLLLAGVVVPLVDARLGRRVARVGAVTRGELASGVLETLRSAPELVVYGRVDDRLRVLRESDARLVGAARSAAFADGTGDLLRLLVTGVTVAGVLAAAIAAHAGGGLDRVLIATLALLALASFEAVQDLPRAARELGSTLASGRRVLDLVDREPAVVDPAEPAQLGARPLTVELEDVRVRYAPDERPALDGFSLRLGALRHVALVGPSGAGKTTVTNLLLRFLDPEAGRVTLGGHDLRTLRQEDVRGAIAVAGQDGHLFSTSILENVRIGRADASDAEVETALRRAGILEWVRTLPEGGDTLVGEEGHALSGGQRQRLVVARALLADAPVLVLDEPTAHLDVRTAERLVADVVAAARDRTLLLITHRPEGLELMDEVVRIEAPDRAFTHSG
jgi:ATP-binding cassette, subfamily C, bacterial CydC